MVSNLFSPLRVGSVEVKNRVALAPLTRFRADDNFVPTDLMREYYEQRAQAEGTLLISEASYIMPQAGGYLNVPGLWNADQVKGWKHVIDAVHKKRSYFFIQMWAMGRQGNDKVLKDQGFDLVSASNHPLVSKYADPKDAPVPRALTRQEIDEYVEGYVKAAKNAISAGADGVEVHSANGYLLDQFLHANSNDRTDEYGGSIENRARFTLRVVDAVVDAIGAERVGIRIGTWGTFGEMDPGVSPLPQFSYVVTELQRRALEGKQLAYIHLIEPTASGKDIGSNDRWTSARQNLNDFVRYIWDGVIIRAGNLVQDAKEVADRDNKTLVGIGRYFISNPDLVSRLETGTELTKYDRSTFYIPKSPEGYITYTNATK